MAFGDELAYLFDPRDIFGRELKNVKSLNRNDRIVRETFSNLITKFAYLNSNGNKSSKHNSIFQSFKSEQSNFIRIGEEAILSKDFR